jgi:hypothetical protein
VSEKTTNYNFVAESSIFKNETDLFDTRRRYPLDPDNELNDECNIPVD